MHNNFFYDNLILIPGIVFILTVLIKGLFIKIKTGKIDIYWAFWSWGMPSVHSSVVVSITTAIFLKYWCSSDLFAISMAFTVIILYDAMNVRYEAGRHAKAINKILWKKKYRESLWHLPSEALVWSLFWIAVASLLYFT